MSAATSPGTGLAYGLRRVCAAWGMARSSFYAMTSGQHAEQPPAKRRGPKPAISDQALLVAIEADLEASPWEGEGYRKVWARLRVCRDIRVARKRVLRLMRENNLLSPHRCRRRGGNPHDSEIITHAPNLMWGTDGVRVFTVDDGWGWIFTAVEHWNAECVGWHVCKRGDRFAALQPISMGLAGLYGSTAAGAARGLALRMDHGSQYLSDHFTNQIKFWGIQPSYAFVAEPQTNGVAERFNRTLKEQIIHGRIYRNIAELRDAVRDFVELYNAQWIVEKNGYLSPAQARQAWHAAISISPPRETNLCPRNRVRYNDKNIEAGDSYRFENFRQTLAWLDGGDIEAGNLLGKELGRCLRAEQADVVETQRYIGADFTNYRHADNDRRRVNFTARQFVDAVTKISQINAFDVPVTKRNRFEKRTV